MESVPQWGFKGHPSFEPYDENYNNKYAYSSDRKVFHVLLFPDDCRMMEDERSRSSLMASLEPLIDLSGAEVYCLWNQDNKIVAQGAIEYTILKKSKKRKRRKNQAERAPLAGEVAAWDRFRRAFGIPALNDKSPNIRKKDDDPLDFLD